MAANDEIINGINLMREGNQEGFNILYNHTHDYVYKRARFIMKNEDDALDLMQETYTQVYKNIASLENAENIYAWIGAIEYRQGMQIFRRKKEILVDEEAEAIFDDIVSEDMDANPEETAEARATVDIVMSFIEELPELQKASIIAFYYDNKKIDDIAAEFECSPNTIKSRLNYAKKFLKDKVESHEKSHGYKLHTVSPVIIIAALRALFNTKKYAISPEVSQTLCANVLKTSGATSTGAATATSATATSAATTSATATSAATTSSGATAATAVTSATASTSASAVATAAAVATKVGMGIGAKIAIGAAAVALTAAVTVGVIAVVSDKEEATTPIESTVELADNESTENVVGENDSKEATTENAIENTTESTTEPATEETALEDWSLLEGQYVYSYGGFDNALVISNVNAPSDDINDVTFDVEYCGMKGENIVINDRTVTFTVNHDDGSVSDVKLLIWTDYVDNNEYGQLIELKGVTTTTSDGMVADMNNIAPVIYSKKMAKETDPVMHWWTIDDGEYASNTMFEATKPDGYTYSVSIATTQYSADYGERVVTIEIYDKDGQLVDTLVSEPFSYSGEAYCNFWARSSEGKLFVGRLDGKSGNQWLILNCHLTGVEAPAWYEGSNIYTSLTK